MQLQPALRFGHFKLDLAVPLLTYDSRSLELAPKALEVLAILVRNAGQVVRKDDLLSLIWPHNVVEEGNLAVHVSSLRKAIAKHDTRNYIETVPKRGYRFVAPVQVISRSANPGHTDTRALFRLAEHYLLQSTAAASRKATDVYEKCINIDPLDTAARAGLADSLLMQHMTGGLRADEFARSALRVLAEAEEIDPGCPQIYISLSRVHCAWDWNWQAAAEELQRACELAVDDTAKLLTKACWAFHDARVGDVDRAIRQLKLVTVALPFNPHIWYYLAEALYAAHDFTGAVAVSNDALAVHPNCWYLHAVSAKPLTMLGEYSAALRHLRVGRLLHPGHAGLTAAIAWVHAMAGSRDRAFKLLTGVTADANAEQPSLSAVAMVHAALGDNHGALNKIEAACSAHEWYVGSLRRECALDCLRSQSRFQQVLSRVGI